MRALCKKAERDEVLLRATFEPSRGLRLSVEQVKELITQIQAETCLRIIAVAAPAAGLVVGGTTGIVRRRLLADAAVGLAVGLVGTVVYGLWRMYLAFGEGFGFTNVWSVAIQLIIFLGLGAAAGAVVQKAVAARKPRGRIQDIRSGQEEKLDAS